MVWTGEVGSCKLKTGLVTSAELFWRFSKANRVLGLLAVLITDSFTSCGSVGNGGFVLRGSSCLASERKELLEEAANDGIRTEGIGSEDMAGSTIK